VFTLWTVTVYLVRQKKNFWIMLIPALFMTTVCSTYVFISPQMLHLPEVVGYPLGIACLVVAIVWFTVWYKRHSNSMRNE
jgi:carbon starvation protein CstA